MATDILPAASPSVEDLDRRALVRGFRAVRRQSVDLCRPLEIEDYGLQSIPDASPAKWHLAHTTWFFETFLLDPLSPGYQSFHPQFNFLFNSYYNAIGPRWARPQRGLLSRPTVAEVYRYRESVDEHIVGFLERAGDRACREALPIVTLGMHHEQQHQELILTDLKHALALNPLKPAYQSAPAPAGAAPALRWINQPGGLVEIGHSGGGFAFDNESPRHRVYCEPHLLANRLTTNAEYQSFMADGGYDRPELWLSDGWAVRQAEEWTSPLYWHQSSSGWEYMTLAGWRPVLGSEPVCHLSFYEADAYARWAGARLPTEAEWEAAAAGAALAGHFLESGHFHPHPTPASDDAGGPGVMLSRPGTTLSREQKSRESMQASGDFHALFGDVWQWTSSPYVAYPGYRPLKGALGEYNAKFMCNQMVLRGASCVTPRSHARHTYRNFFPPNARWQFTGIRLARDLP